MAANARICQSRLSIRGRIASRGITPRRAGPHRFAKRSLDAASVAQHGHRPYIPQQSGSAALTARARAGGPYDARNHVSAHHPQYSQRDRQTKGNTGCGPGHGSTFLVLDQTKGYAHRECDHGEECRLLNPGGGTGEQTRQHQPPPIARLGLREIPAAECEHGQQVKGWPKPDRSCRRREGTPPNTCHRQWPCR